MTVITGSPFSGESEIQVVETAGSAVFTFGTAALGAGTAASNQVFEATAATAITLYWAAHVATGLADSFATLDYAIYDDNLSGGTVVASGTLISGTFAAALLTTAYSNTGSVSFTPATPGTYRLALSVVTNTTAGGNITYTSDGPNSTTQAGDTVNWAKGYLRAGCPVSSANLSNVSASGATPSPWAYPDDIYAQAVLATAPANADATQTMAVTEGARSGTASNTSGTFAETAGIGPLDKTDIGGADTGTFTVNFKPANSALSGRPWMHFTAAPTGWALGATDGGTNTTGAVNLTSPAETLNVTMDFTFLLQLNQNTFSTPPMSTNHVPHARLTSDIGFLSCQVNNARTEPQSGISLSHVLADQKGLAAAIDWSDATATEGGQPGWASTLEAWLSALPGGAWTHTATITAPSGLVGTESGNTDDLTLLALNPSYRVICGGGVASPLLAGDHWRPGEEFLVGAALFDRNTDELLVPDSNPTFVFGRFNLSVGMAEYLGSDYAWHSIDTAGPAYEWAMTAASFIITGGDTNSYLGLFTAAETAAWYPFDIFIQVKALYGGTPYIGTAECDPAGLRNSHIGSPFALKLGPLTPRS